MMKNVFMLPYRAGSKSAKELSKSLGVKRIKLQGSKYRARDDHVIINWGNSIIPENVEDGEVINRYAENAQNKLRAFQEMKGYVSIPPFTESREEAAKWLLEGSAVVCRTILNGHSGNGIIIADTLDEMVDAPLYVKYIPKNNEYRVHVIGDIVIHVQRKARNREVPDPNWRIRNHHNGFIFAINGVDASADVRHQSVLAVAALDLDFGAVDVIENKKGVYVLEVNTAPGLEGTTLEKYAEGFRENIG